MHHNPVTDHERAKMRKLRSEHLTLDQIAGITGRTGKCVQSHVKDIPYRARPGIKSRTPAQNARLLAAAAAGVSSVELGSRFGLKPSSVPPTVSRLRRSLRDSLPSTAPQAETTEGARHG